MPEFTKEQLQQMDRVIQASTSGNPQTIEAMRIEEQIFGTPPQASGQPIVAISPPASSSPQAASAVGGPPTRRTVSTVPIDAATGLPATQEQLSSAAAAWANMTTAAGQFRFGADGTLRYEGLAGSVQLPKGVRPNVPATRSVMDWLDGSLDTGKVTRFAPPSVPYAEGSINENKDQTRLRPQGALAFAGDNGNITWQDIASAPPADRVEMEKAANEGRNVLALTPLPRPNREPAPVVPAAPHLYQSAGYVYQQNAGGAYVKVGVLHPALRDNGPAAAAYALGKTIYLTPQQITNQSPEALAALRSGKTNYQVNGAMVPLYSMGGQVRNTYGDSGLFSPGGSLAGGA